MAHETERKPRREDEQSKYKCSAKYSSLEQTGHRTAGSGLPLQEGIDDAPQCTVGSQLVFQYPNDFSDHFTCVQKAFWGKKGKRDNVMLQIKLPYALVKGLVTV